MKKIHHASLKFHTLYSIVLSVIFLVVLLIVRDVSLGVAMFFLVLYVVGNGIIHARKSELKQDTILEYVLVSIIALTVIVGVVR